MDSNDSTPEPAASAPTTCMKCKSSPAEYQSVPCGCSKFCKPCAMKLATGGICKVCSELYGEVKRMAPK
eukprot:m.183957 g.183957  ORF g.183957 m.183957 type:complete len:69 (+) comp15987_c0_seq1:56-262(+)